MYVSFILSNQKTTDSFTFTRSYSLFRKYLQATKVYTEQLLELHRGQGMEIYWRDNFTCPTESEYKLMTIRKTGGLFMLAIRLMKLFSDSDKDFSKLTAILGLYFQIRDDYCNLTSKEVKHRYIYYDYGFFLLPSF